MKKFITTIFIVGTLFVSSIVSAFAGVTFTDIKTTNWAYPYINKLVEKGGVNGYPNGSFKPSTTITSAEFVKTIIALIDGEKESLETDKHWASGYMMIAEDVLQIVPKGMFEKSDWNKPITREKMGVIMERTAQLFYEEDTESDKTKVAAIQSSIKDYNSICDYCKEYIVQAVSRGLITGYEDGTFKPKSTATRAEASTMIVRLVEPVYRSTEVKTENQTPQDSDVVKKGTNVTDILTQDLMDKGLGDYAKDYVVLKNADRFNLKYLYSNDKNFYVEYRFFGKVYTLDKNMNLIEVSDPTNEWGTEANPAVQKQAFDGKLKDTAYFIFMQVHDYDNTIFLVPNTLI